MAWLAFSKKAQIKNIALNQLNHLFRTLEITSGMPPSFWQNPYSIGFVFGQIMGVGLYVAGNKVRASDVNQATADVLFELAPNEAAAVARRVSEFGEKSEFNEGHTNGTILALFLLHPAAVEKEPIVIEARRRTQNIGTALDSLPSSSRTGDHEKAASILSQMIFYEKVWR